MAIDYDDPAVIQDAKDKLADGCELGKQGEVVMAPPRNEELWELLRTTRKR